ncbi:MAG: hypothetical protein EXS55_01340 [Candidatus Magasanikbacteria bacterium]|nr:hypothetical protein [Candidatus Magasanikbacteria bacterium]
MSNQVQNSNITTRFSVIFLWIIASLIFLVMLACGAAAAYDRSYSGRVYPGVYFGAYPMGGLTGDEAVVFLENLNNRLSKEGVTLTLPTDSEKTIQIKLTTVSAGDNAVELIQYDSVSGAKMAMTVGRSGSFSRKLFAPLGYLLAAPRQLLAAVITNDAALEDALRAALSSFEDKPRNAAIQVSLADPNNPAIIEAVAGQVFNYSEIITDLKKRLARLDLGSIPLTRHPFVPTVTASDVASVSNRVPRLLSYGNIVLNFINPENKVRHDFVIPPSRWVDWLEVRPSDSGFMLALNEEKLKNYLDATIRPEIDISSLDAKFSMEGGKVQEFQASRSGRTMNIAKTSADLAIVFAERNFEGAKPLQTVSASVDIIEPSVKTADVNNLGITDIMGVGISTFKDSHTNRIKNIARAVAKLNGVLIKPGENFSLLARIGPFTSSSGYLPELVIKGKEIKPEIGGGMCQIGSTMFRVAMNSGMDITERRNHSLVVSYYSDPVNGNPGTDATVYDPAPDFRFRNDTGNYLLLQTDIDYVKQQLTFTLWGKPDGRSGSYTHPIVSRWIPAGEPVETIVTDGKLKPGQKKCQEAFRGAVASFTYTRFTSSSEKMDRVFESYYRPLPKTCMIGAELGSVSSTPGAITIGDTALEVAN